MKPNHPSHHLGPLSDGATVAIIGGGPGGIACALTLQREAARRAIRLRIVVYEGKRFGMHYNQCSGVLSPPLVDILKEKHDLVLPPALVEREIQGYVLHSENEQIALSGPEYGGPSLAVRRVQFDEFLERCARERGIEIIPARATDVEFRRDEAIVFSWSGLTRAAVVVGAFGLSRAMTATLSRRTRYEQPHALDTVITNFRPNGSCAERIPALLGNCIHVFLPPFPRIEFGALIPKGDHVTVIIAGEDVRTDDMDAFLGLPAVRRVLGSRIQPQDYFKGCFPVSLARGAFGDRYVTVGDAAGLVRPFKGKGINSALISGGLAAETMMEVGVSGAAFRSFYAGCHEITGDLWFGRLVRVLARIASREPFMDSTLRLARRDAHLRELLFDCVSGRESYRRIVLRAGNAGLGVQLGALFLLGLVPRALGGATQRTDSDQRDPRPGR